MSVSMKGTKNYQIQMKEKYLQVLTKESIPNTSGTFDLLCLKNVSDRQKETSDNHRAIMS